MSLVLPEFGLLFWMALSFGIVFFIVAKFGFPVIVRSVEERKNFIDSSLAAAEQANERLANLQAEGQALLDTARAEQLAILREAAQTKDKIVAEAKDSARKEAQKLLEDAQKQIRREKDAALTEIRSQVAVLAVDIAEKVLRNELKDKAPQLELVNRLIDEAQSSEQPKS